MYLRDPIHGLIGFDAPEDDLVLALLDTAEVQRLRRVRQLGVTNIAFHGAEHTRFSHVVGAAHVMKRLVGWLRASSMDLGPAERLDADRIRDAVAAALVHDLGHGPFSHLFEVALPGARSHEAWTADILLDPSTEVNRVLARFGADRAERIVSILRGQYAPAYVSRAVSGPLDVDRCDYLLRDSHMTGVRYGVFDLDWLLRSQRFAKSPEGRTVVAVDGKKGIAAVEEYFTGRLFMFQQVYLHKTTRAVEWIIQSILKRVTALVRDGRSPDPLPAGLRSVARGEPISLGEYLELDDAVLFSAFGAWSRTAQDAILRDLCGRLLGRRLFKTIEVSEDRAEGERARLTDVAKRLGLDPAYYTGLDRAAKVAYGEPQAAADKEIDEIWVAQPDGRVVPLPEASLIVGRLRGVSFGVTRLIAAPEVREAFKRSTP